MSIVPASKRIPAGILGIFLGGLGLHKFYMGFNRAGAVMLILYVVGWATACIGGGILVAILHTIGFAEGIIYLVRNDSDFYTRYMVRRQEWF